MWSSRFKRHSDIQQSENHHYEPNINYAFTIPKDLIIHDNLLPASLFHGGIDSPSLNAIDPISRQTIHITKYLKLKSKRITQEYLNHLYERILLTSHLSHPNVCRILSWYVADGCVYSITNHIPTTLRHAIQTERFSILRIRHVTEQILRGTIYLQSKGLCPLTPWYTTNIELTADDHIRLCSPTISTTKLNGGVVQHHHLWRHPPERLILMFMENQHEQYEKLVDQSKEDVWSIGCIIVEMMIHRILFHPQNDDPSLQLFSIVQHVGGLEPSLIKRFPMHIQNLFLTLRTDPHQKRLPRLIQQIYQQYKQNNDSDDSFNSHLCELLSQMFQFNTDKRISLRMSIEHPFFLSTSSRTILHSSCQKEENGPYLERNSSITSDDLIRLCTKINLNNARWKTTLKERCLLEFVLRLNKLTDVNLDGICLNQSLKVEIRKLIEFFTG